MKFFKDHFKEFEVVFYLCNNLRKYTIIDYFMHKYTENISVKNGAKY